MRSKALRLGFPVIVLGVLTLPTILFAQTSLSHVRVVRLSYVSGTVEIKRPDSTEWAKAIVNTPLQEGFQISTDANSYAEAEFENGSTARIGEFSKLSFDQLALDEDGNKLNRLTFEKGYATFHFLPEHHDAYSVKVAGTTLTPNGKTLFRADLEPGKARVEVFSGSIQAASGSNEAKLGKDKVLEFDPASTEIALNATTGIVKDSWDKWTSSRDTQAQLALSDQGYSTRNAMYGWSDLGAYGEWAYFDGFGYGWAPFASMGWSPYSMGMWSWYPGMGYTWISSEPWGWMPYHFGNWSFSPGFGWFWMPNGSSVFSPALVSWYSGPGWVGWAPRGVRGAAGQNIVTTTSGSVVQTGILVGPQNVIRMPTTAGTEIKQMPFQPGSAAMMPGARVSAAAGAGATMGPRSVTAHGMAPPSILMGGNAAAESSLQGKHFNEPLRARMGTTLGGQYNVGGNVGEFRGDAFKGTGGPHGTNGPQGPQFSRGAPAGGGPTFVPHGSQSAGAPHAQAAGNASMGGRGAGGGGGNTSVGTMNSSAIGGGGGGGGGHAGGGGGGGGGRR